MVIVSACVANTCGHDDYYRVDRRCGQTSRASRQQAALLLRVERLAALDQDGTVPRQLLAGLMAMPKKGARCSPLRPRALFYARREQIDDLSDAGRPKIGAAARPIDPAQVRLAVELREGIEECARRRPCGKRCGNVVG